MSFDGNGNYNLPLAPVVAGTTILDSWANTTLADIAAALTLCLKRDGQGGPQANQGWNNYRLTGLGAGVNPTDAIQLQQVQALIGTYVPGVAGTNTLTGAVAYTVAYTAGKTFSFIVPNTNTGAVTININSLGAQSIVKNGTTALAAGDLVAGEICVIEYDGTNFQRVGAVSPTAVQNALASVATLTLQAVTVTGATSLQSATVLAPAQSDNSAAVPSTAWVNGTNAGKGMMSVSPVPSDLNSPTLGWAAYNNSTTNSPASSTYGQVCTVSITASATPASDNWIQQFAFDTGAGMMYQRQNITNSGWTAWRQTVAVDQFGYSFATNGYQKLPGGLILQWGSTTSNGTAFSFPTSFPNACLNATATARSWGSSNDPVAVSALTATQITIAWNSSNSNINSAGVFWHAIGY